MATNTSQKEEDPRKTLTLTQDLPSDRHSTEDPKDSSNTSSPLQQLDGSIKDGGDESKATTADPTVAVNSSNNSGSVTDTQKKIRRAERFGMPVQLSEEDKRNSRAERFGTGSGLQGSDAIKKSEEQKRKARAERFGLAQSVPADQEAKKKARLARFAPVSKTDSLEDDKKKARALRFSQTSSSLSQANGKGNMEPKPAIAGKAGGVV